MRIIQKVQSSRWQISLRELIPHPMLLGFAFFFGWNYVTFFSDIITDERAMDALGRFAHVFPSAVANVLTSLVIVVLSRRVTSFGQHRIAGITFSFVGGVGTLLVYLAGEAQTPSAAGVTVGACLTGISSAWAISLWGEIYSSYEDRRSSACILASVIAGFVIYLVLTVLPKGIAVAGACCLLPACGMLALMSCRQAEEVVPVWRRGSAREWLGVGWRILIAIFAFGTVFWASPLLSGSQPVGVVTISCSVVIGALAVLIGVMTSGRVSMSMVYRIVLPLMLAGMLVALVATGEVQRTVGAAVAMGGFTCLDCLTYVVYAQLSRVTGFSPAAAFAVGHCAEALSIPAGWLALGLVRDIGSMEQGELVMTVVVAIVLIVVSGLVVIDRDMLSRDDRDASPGTMSPIRTTAALFARQCEVAIVKYELTDREEQILLFTTRGRSVPFIASRMGLSTSTVKTHTRHIYEKMGVSGRQEMLDLIEAITVESS